jgi:cation diffusion facilitator CzcD-associated flavoprotein CzcO
VTRVAIVGGGLAGFSAYQTLRRGGLAASEIAVFFAVQRYFVQGLLAGSVK